MVELVGRPAVEVLVRSVLVVPVEVAGQFFSHVAAAQWDDDAACSLLFERSVEALDHGNAAVLSDGAEAWSDVLPLTPGLEAVAPELRALVTDDVLGLGLGVQATKEYANLDGRGLFAEYGHAHCPTREMGFLFTLAEEGPAL